MPQQKSVIEHVGKIAERIVANELEMQGFLVRDLNMEGIAANADLLAFKGDEVWQIQVKGSSYDTNYPNDGWWFQYGYCKQEHIDDETAQMFNRAKGPLKANAVALVCVRSASEYQCIFLPVDVAEKAAKINLGYAYRTLKQDGSKKKPNMVWMSFYRSRARNEDRLLEADREREMLKGYLLDRSKTEDMDRRKNETDASTELFQQLFGPTDPQS